MRRIVTEKPKKDWGDWRRKIPLEAFGEIVHLRDLIITHNMTPFLFFGSLLGWYRECSIITHTQDFDFGIRVIEMNENFLKAIETIEAPFWAERRLGLRNESLEYTVKSLKYHFPVDIFFLYDTDNFTYAAGQSPGLTSYRFSWPKIVDDEICAGELFNHFFYVPCEIDRHIVHEFGAEWKKDRPSRHFSWSSGAKNSKIHKRYPKFMRKQVEKFY
ncbi:unnamed protein product, partial [Mesorhabditis belari]|uniref:Fukutin n=1 Tax=Mesorhabditis belari TaxID=2138241 RepID=A0AAF3EUP7_9BILA